MLAALLSAYLIPAGTQSDPITFYRWTTAHAPSLDPQRIADPTSADIVANLFLGLTEYDPQAAEVRPLLARRWETLAEGQTFVFTLRDDIYWVRYNADTGTTARVRTVTAEDFVEGVRRACTPEGGVLGALLASIVEGCDALTGDAAREQIGVRATSPDTLEIRLTAPAGWFLAVTPALRPVPVDVIQRHGIEWTIPDNLVTNGPFVLARYTPGLRFVFEHNPYLPEDLAGAGSVQRVQYDVVDDVSAGFSLYLEHKVDRSRLPPNEAAGFAGQIPDEAVLVPDQRVAYAGFTNDRAPFNDARVRRAFAAAVDRSAFVGDVLGGQGVSLLHLTPPQVFGAPPADRTGIAYSPALARDLLAEAGYPGCDRFPRITVLAHESMSTWTEFLVTSWELVLQCNRSVFQVELVEFPELLARTAHDARYAGRPHVFLMVWRGEYADAHNWAGDLLWCETEPRTRRDCGEVDDLIARAAALDDPTQRKDLYLWIEADLFGPEGEMPIVPLFQYARWEAVKPWLEHPLPLDGGLPSVGIVRWDAVTIDGERQTRCRDKEADPVECHAPMMTLPPPPTPTLTPAASATPTPISGEFDDISIPVGTPLPTLAPLASPTPEFGDVGIPITPTGEFGDVDIPITPTPP